MDQEMNFGEIREAPPRFQLRPDLNKHFAVAAYGVPAEEDLPIFVDLDVLRDMEQHALSDTTVELGGVLLGGCYVDAEGRPFVVISDSLRAEHYESTKGSFKFTHDTWSEITRQRDEFPQDLQMVGWYHTHPDWGVFLSGMDMFICEHFFNKPLDVALVIDPCRGDRGFFQWSGTTRRHKRRTGGFYLIASRFREAELQYYVESIEGRRAMTTDPRSRPVGPPYSAPVVHLSEPRSLWTGIATMGMLTAQFFLLALIAWKLLTPLQPLAENSAPPDNAEQRLLELAELDRARTQNEAHAELLNALVAQLNGVPDALVESYEQQKEENERLDALVRGQLALEEQLRRENRQLVRKQQQASAESQRREQALKENIELLTRKNQQLSQRNQQYVSKVADLSSELSRYRPDVEGRAGADENAAEKDQREMLADWNWTWIGITASALAVLTIAGTAIVLAFRKADEQEEPPAERE